MLSPPNYPVELARPEYHRLSSVLKGQAGFLVSARRRCTETPVFSGPNWMTIWRADRLLLTWSCRRPHRQKGDAMQRKIAIWGAAGAALLAGTYAWAQVLPWGQSPEQVGWETFVEVVAPSGNGNHDVEF